MNYYFSITIGNIDLDIECYYSYEKGVYTLSNGDPGYPDCEEFQINEVIKNGIDYSDVLNRFHKIYPEKNIWNSIEEIVYKHIEEYESDCDYEPDYDYY